jgi:HEPN domain-containing protein
MGFMPNKSCEKFLKALLAAHGVVYPLTHQIGELLNLLASSKEVLPPLPYDPLRLMPFAVQFRYDDGAKLSDEQREDMRESAALLREHVVARILELERLTP